MPKKSKLKTSAKVILSIAAALVLLGLLSVAALAVMNHAVLSAADGRIIPCGAPSPDADQYDCILVLGAGVKDNGTPSDMLTDRLLTGIALYESGVAPKLLMSGDHGTVGYDEVNTMKAFAIERGVPTEDIFMDHAGFSTYESLYRAKAVFGVKRLIIVTQEYHLSRALFIAEKLGLEAIGVGADIRTYRGQSLRDAREVLARAKDVVTTYFMTPPKYLGEKIDITGNGDVTND